MRFKTAITLLLVSSLYLGALPLTPSANILAQRRVMTPDDPNQPNGLRFRLSAGADQPDALPPGNIAPATPLSEGDTANLLKRLPPGKTDPNDKQDFALRDKSLPPPRTGQTVQKPFPAPDAPQVRPPDVGDSGPLEVVRFSPQGEVPAAPQLQITFSQPMIPITSQDEAASIVPVRIAPQVPGKWRWLGTRTLMFAPEGRFPMATVYKVSIPAGTKSVNGGALAKEFSFTFSTPPPTAISKYPEGQNGLARDTMIYLAFDQKIDPAKILAVTRVTANAKPLKTRLATEQEAAGWKNSAEPGRWLAVRFIDNEGQTANALPGDANIIVTVGPNIPSAEGPRTNPKTVSFNFRTYGALKMVNFQCGYNNKCSPFDNWQINFSNPLDTANFKREMLTIEPAAPDVKAAVYGNTIQLTGIKKGRTKYTVTIDQNLKDVYGQTLGKPEQAIFNVGSADQTLFAPGGDMVILDPTGPARYTVYTTNHTTLNVKLYAVAPSDWPAWAAYRRYREGYDDDEAKKQATPPGRLVFNKAVTVNNKPDELTETGIDLTPALKGDFGQIIAIIEQPGLTQRVRRRWERNNVEAWIQRTQIGLDAFVDHQQLVGWANSLKDGKPVSGAELTITPGNAEVIGRNADKPEQGWGEWLMGFVSSEQKAEAEEVSEAHANPQPLTPNPQSTGADGLLRFALPTDSSKTRLLVARKGNDVAILPEYDHYYQSGSNWYKRNLGESLRWFTFDDRKLYRPGEEVKIKGWLRRVTNGPTGDVEAFNNSFKSLNYTLRDAQGNEVTKGTANINALGGFDLSLKLPPTMNLGDAYVQFTSADNSHSYQHQFSVQEFRRPEFEVSAQTSEGPHYVGGAANVTVSASYFAGGGLANADVNWRVTAKPTTYTPPGWDEWTFGTWVPWWYSYNENYAGQSTQAFAGKTDAAGKHRLKVDFDGVKPPRAYAIEAEASVQDVNRQSFAARSSFIVHPSRAYVGLKAERAFVEQGTPLNMQAAAVDVDGKPIVNRDVAIKAVRLDWEFENGSWQQKELNTQEFNVKTDAQGRIAYRVETKGGGGRYRVTARVMDDNERPNESEMTLWVSGGKVVPSREVTQEKIELIPSKKEFQPGDTAEILVQAPFTPAEGILTLRREGLVTTQRFRVENSTYTLKIPIAESYLPNIMAQVDLVGAASRTDDKGQVDAKLPKRPAFASGSLNLSIPPLKRKLSVATVPRDKAVTPGGETVVNVEVKDANGEPVRDSEIAVIVVDESVLALTGYKITDPLYTFYTSRSDGVSDFHSRSKILLGNPDDVAKEAEKQNNEARDSVSAEFGRASGGVMAQSTMAAPGAPPPSAKPVAKSAARNSLDKEKKDSDDAPNQPEIRLRENFNALAVFAPVVPTDGNGRAEVKVKLPDNLTRYRVTAVAVSGGKLFGIGESAITARQPLMVRPSAPRFLNFGDKFELPVVVQNQTDDPMTVDVGIRATNLTLTAGAGRRVVVPANDRVEVRFPAAAEMAGTARLQIGVSSGKWADAAEISLPVWTPATTEAFATYGQMDANGAMSQPVQLPGGVVKQFGGLEITTSSTQLQELTDAVIYLQNYPYGCSEQISSRVLGIAALKDVLTAFKAKELPSPEELKKGVEGGIKTLQGRQNDDGSFGLWKRNDYGNDWPFLTLHVTHALVRAKAKGFNVPDEMLKKALGYVKSIESHIPKYYSKESRWAISAYALNLRAIGGDKDTAKARKLIAEAGLEKLSLESVGWLLTVLSGDATSATQVTAIRRLLNNRVTETAGAANFVDSYTDGAQFLLHSNRRTDGIILEALIGDQPENDLIPKIVRGLLANKTRGHWLNTQENVFILLALDKYFNTYEKVEPNFVARVWLGNAYAGEQAYKGRSTDRNNINVPMSYLFDHPGQQNLILDKQGAGRLYYRIGLNYAPADLLLKAADYGFKVERIYEAVDKPEDVKRDTDGTWRVKAGTRVRIRLKMTVPSRRYHVALVDPLPAGLEILNPELATTERLPEDTGQTGVAEYGSRSYGYGSYWYRSVWFDHQNFRDERAEAFTSLLWEGVWNYSYVARATTPGRFVVPPAKAEEMYMPETFGRSATDKVVVE